MVYVKLHHSGDSSILAVCDEDLIGKTLTQGELSMKVSEKFYKGEAKSDEEVINLMRASSNINILGEKSIALAIKAGINSKENISSIGGVPHAQVIA